MRYNDRSVEDRPHASFSWDAEMAHDRLPSHMTYFLKHYKTALPEDNLQRLKVIAHDARLIVNNT